MTRFLRTFAFCIGAILVAMPTLAAPTLDPVGATAFKTVLEKTIANYESNMALAAPIKVVRDGELTVEISKGYYAATLPSMHLDIPVIASPGQTTLSVRVDIGKIAINVVPGDREGVWVMAIAFSNPVRMTLTPSDNVEKSPVVMELSVEEQKSYIVVWDTNLDAKWGVPFGGVIKSDVDYKGLRLQVSVPAKETIDINMSGLRYTHDYTIDESGKLSGPILLSLEGVALDLPQSEGQPVDLKFRLGNLGVAGKMQDIDIHTAMSHYKPFLEANKRMNDALNSSKEPSSEDVLAFFDNIVGLYTNILSSIEGTYTLSDLSVNWADLAKGNGARAGFALNEIKFGIQTQGFVGDSAALREMISYKGLVITPSPIGIAPTIPVEGRFNLAIEGIPAKTLLSIAREATVAATKNPGSGSGVMFGVMAKLPGVLASSGLKVTLSDTKFQNGIYSVSLEGSGKASVASVTMTEGSLRIVFTGLDALIAALETQSAKGPEEAAYVNQILPNLVQSKAMGEKQSEKDAYVFAFVMGTDGSPTLNGKPLFPKPEVQMQQNLEITPTDPAQSSGVYMEPNDAPVAEEQAQE